MAIPYNKTWNRSTTAYQMFQKCADGLLKIHPDLNKFNIDLDDLYYIPDSASDEIIAQFAYNKAYKVGLFAMRSDYLSYEELLASMIHEFAHCLNFIESAYIINKKGVREFGHGKAFREACRRLAKIICTEKEYKLCLLTAFDGPLHVDLSDTLYYDGISLQLFEKDINTSFTSLTRICSIKELLKFGIVENVKQHYGINLLREVAAQINLQQNLNLDTCVKNAEEFYNYSENIKELGFCYWLINWRKLKLALLVFQ